MSRMPHADPAGDASLASVYSRIEKTRGQVSNILKTFSNAPDGLAAFSGLGEYVRYRTALEPREREFAILSIARGIEYAWLHHVPPALKAGITQEELDVFHAGSIPATASRSESACIQFALEFVNGGQVSDKTYAMAKEVLTLRQVTDLGLVCAYFIALGFSVNAFQVDLESNYKPLRKDSAPGS